MQKKYANHQFRHNHHHYHHHHQHNLIQWPKSILPQGTLDENSQRWTMKCQFDDYNSEKYINSGIWTQPNPTQPIDELNPRPCLWWPIKLFKEPVFGPIRWPSATANLAACLTANLVPCPIDGGGDFSCWPIGAILLLNIQLPKPCEAEVDHKTRKKQVPRQAVWSNCAWKLSGGRSSAQCSNRKAESLHRSPRSQLGEIEAYMQTY